jgi:hypothetical protein
MTQTELENLWLHQFQLDLTDLNLSVDGGSMQTPNEYIAAGIDPDTYLKWYDVGGVDIDRMLELKAAGISIKLLGTIATGRDGYSYPIAYCYCNGDLNLDEVKAILAHDDD